MAMITLTARCHPALEPILPKPVLAADALPGWLRTMPSEVASDTLGGAPIRTLKHCPPLIDALGLPTRRVAIAVNRDVVPRSAFATHQLAANDRVEILEAVGGG